MSCRACGYGRLESIHNFGPMPLAGDYYSGLYAERYPLEIQHCKDCDVMQVKDTVPHNIIFNPKYCYSSSTVPALREHFAELAVDIADLVDNPRTARVFEIGCNDGILLDALGKLGISATGVDASANLVSIAKAQEHDAVEGVFNSKWAEEWASKLDRKYDLVTCSNVFAHNEDPNDFLQGVRKILDKDGLLAIEVHDGSDLIRLLQWDCFYHEHVFYWNRYSLGNILIRNGFEPVIFSKTDMHGGALRVIARFPKHGIAFDPTSKLPWNWERFSKDIQRSIEVLQSTLSRFDYLNVYSVPGRCVTLLNALKPPSILGAYDASPLRAGKYIPGLAVPIYPEDQFPDMLSIHKPFVLLGAWHLKEDLLKKLEPHRSKINGIITPLPNVQIF